jgi:hypothetical protein
MQELSCNFFQYKSVTNRARTFHIQRPMFKFSGIHWVRVSISYFLDLRQRCCFLESQATFNTYYCFFKLNKRYRATSSAWATLYSLRPIILFANIDVSRHILMVDTSVLEKSNMSRREYLFSEHVFRPFRELQVGLQLRYFLELIV